MWWECGKCLYEWRETINNRIKGENCLCCLGTGKIIDKKLYSSFIEKIKRQIELDEKSEEKSLKSTHPALAAQWHPYLNEDLESTDVTYGSSKKVWWLCPVCGYEWEAAINNRTRGTGCPKCAQSGMSFPELALHYYISQAYPEAIYRYKQAGFEVDTYIPSIKTGIEYDGSYYHKDKLERDNLKDEFCEKHGIRLIRLRSKKLKPTNSAEIIWLKNENNNGNETGIKELLSCLKVEKQILVNFDDDYDDIINVKILKVKKDSISENCPELATQWHPTKNGDKTPDKYSFGSHVKIWWLCPDCGHEWQSPIYYRFHGQKVCPNCKNKKS